MKWTEKNIWTLGFEPVGQKIAPLYFKTDRVAETALRALWFWTPLARLFSILGDFKLTCDGLGFQGNGQRKNIWTFGFELLGRIIVPLHFKTQRIAETALRASWFWATLARFAGTWAIFSRPRDFKLTSDGLGCQWNGQRKNIWTFGFELLGRIQPHFILRLKE